MAKDYEVLKIDELSKMSETRGIEKYYRLQIKTKGGVVLTVDIDEADYTEEKVSKILLEQAQKSDRIKALTS